MFDRLRSLFGKSTETRTIQAEDAVDFLLDQRGEEIEKIEKNGKKHLESVEDKLEELKNSLDVLQSYEEENVRINDITSNVAARRHRQLEQFDPPQDIETFAENARDLVDDLSQVKQKEKIVLDRVGEAADTVFNNVRSVEAEVEELENFLNDNFELVRQYNELQSLLEQLESLEDERQEIYDELDSIDTEEASENLDDIKQQIQELDDDPEQQKKDELAEQKKQLESEIDTRQQTLNEAAAQMERGLRKLLYNAESGEIEIEEQHVDVLQTIKDGDIVDTQWSTEEIQKAVQAAKNHIKDIDIGERQVERFNTAAEKLEDLDTIQKNIQDIRKHIKEVEKEMNELTIEKRREELKKDRKNIVNDIQSMEREEDQLEQRLAVKNKAIEDTKQELETLLNEALPDTIRLVDES